MANRTVGPGQPGANPAREQTSPGSIGEHAGADRVDNPQPGRDDMNMHTSIKSEPSPAAITVAERAAPLDDTAFFAKTEAMKAAYEAHFAFEVDVLGPAYDTFHKACEAVPHVTFEPDPSIGAKQSLSTADPACLAVAHAVTGDVAYVIDPNSPDAVARYNRMERFAAAADARDAEIARLREKYTATALARSEHLGTIAADLCDELIENPAPSVAALGWKIEHLWGDGGASYCDEWNNAILSDARRLLSRRV